MATESVYMKVEVELNDKFFEDIICTMLEGGSNYWVDHVDIYHPDGKRPKGIYGVPKSVWAASAINKGGTITFHPKEENCCCYQLHKHKLIRGLQDWMHQHPGDITLTNEKGINTIDAGSIDADIADNILQFALFAKLIYG